MDDNPLDLSKKSASSNSESRLLSTEEGDEYAEDLRPTPNRGIPHDENEFSESAQNRERLLKQDSLEFGLSFLASRRHSLPKSREEISRSSAASWRKMGDKVANNAAKRHKSLNSTSVSINKPKLTQAVESLLKSRIEKASEISITLRPSTSTNAKSSSDHLNVQGNLDVPRHASYGQFKCQRCNGWFARKMSLERHSCVNIAESSFQCEICGKEFSCSDDLNQHKKIHVGQKLFKCFICDKELGGKQALRYHLITHKGR